MLPNAEREVHAKGRQVLVAFKPLFHGRIEETNAHLLRGAHSTGTDCNLFRRLGNKVLEWAGAISNHLHLQIFLLGSVVADQVCRGSVLAFPSKEGHRLELLLEQTSWHAFYAWPARSSLPHGHPTVAPPSGYQKKHSWKSIPWCNSCIRCTWQYMSFCPGNWMCSKVSECDLWLPTTCRQLHGEFLATRQPHMAATAFVSALAKTLSRSHCQSKQCPQAPENSKVLS